MVATEVAQPSEPWALHRRLLLRIVAVFCPLFFIPFDFVSRPLSARIGLALGTVMRINELRGKLRDEGIRDDAFSVEGGTPDERYVLSNDGGGNWSVYYSERGSRFSVKTLGSEEHACEELLRRLLDDPTTRK